MLIHNDGAHLVATDYWRTDHARRGLLFLSINGGALRLLVPPAAPLQLPDLPPIGTPVIVTRGPLLVAGGGSARPTEAYELLWDDGTDAPYAVHVDARQADRLIPCAEAGRAVDLVSYVPHPPGGPESVRAARSDRARVRCAPLPCLAPWRASDAAR